MGTSSARWGPSGRLWRLAKGAATRYLAPEGAAPVAAGEVVARYVAALGEGPHLEGQGLLGAFRLTRKTAQNLGAFWQRGLTQGWPAALKEWGLEDLAEGPADFLAQALGPALVPPGFDLEAAATRTALATVLLKALPRPGLESANGLDPGEEAGALVRRFLATSLYQRLVLDLGASLEAAAGDGNRFQAALAELQNCIAAGETDPTLLPQSPEAWLGLPGWTFATQALESLAQRGAGRPRPAGCPSPGAK